MSTLTRMARAKHVEIREWIEHEIQSGRLSIGDRLPSERELMEQFAVSRNPGADGDVQARRDRSRPASPRFRHHRRLDRPAQQSAATAPRIHGRAGGRGHPPRRRHPRHRGGVPPPLRRSVRHRHTRGGTASGSSSTAPARGSSSNGASSTSHSFRTSSTRTSRCSPPPPTTHPTGSISSTPRASSPPHTSRLTTRSILELDTTTPVVRQLRTLHTGNGLPIERLELLFHPTKLTLEVTQIEH